MVRNRGWRSLWWAACAALALSWGVAQGQEVPVVNGTHWTTSTDAVKKAYLVGLANAFQVEAAYESNNPPPDSQSIVPRLTKGMKGQTLDGVRTFVDGWYAKNPDKMQRPVVEIIWFEIVVPGLQKAG
jgi:hypothetical protein